MASDKKNNRKIGDFGEGLAEKYLIGKGYKIVKRNFQNRYGEVDLIVERDKDLVFVEVKTKTSRSFGEPSEMVDRCKVGKISTMLGFFVSSNKRYENYNLRIDVVSIVIDKRAKKAKIEHIENFDN